MFDSIEKFLESMSDNGASPNTVQAYRSDLNGFVHWIKGHHHIDNWPTALASGATAAEYVNTYRGEWAPATTVRKVACLRKFGKSLGIEGYLADYRSPTPAKGVPHPLVGGVEDVRKMINVCYRPHHRALIAMCGLLGLRVSEARSVRVDDLIHDPSTGRTLLRVRGKGEKERIIPVSTEAAHWIDTAVAARSLNPWDRIVPVDDRAARRAITRAGKRAGLGMVASHDLRMTFGTEAHRRSGGNLRVVQEFLGHASSKTTEGYTGVNMDEMEAVASF